MIGCFVEYPVLAKAPAPAPVALLAVSLAALVALLSGAGIVGFTSVLLALVALLLLGNVLLDLVDACERTRAAHAARVPLAPRGLHRCGRRGLERLVALAVITGATIAFLVAGLR